MPMTGKCLPKFLGIEAKPLLVQAPSLTNP